MLLHLGSLFSSQVIDGVGLLWARIRAIVVDTSQLWLVANVAEDLFALLTRKQVFTILLPVEAAALWTLATESDVNVGVLLASDVFLD